MRHNIVVECFSLFEGLIEFDLTDLASHGGLSELRHRIDVVINAVGGFVGVQHFQIQHAINYERNIVACNGPLGGHIESLFLECSVVGNAIEEGIEEVEPRLQRSRVFAEPLNDKRSILWDEFYSFGQNDDQYYGNREGADEAE